MLKCTIVWRFDLLTPLFGEFSTVGESEYISVEGAVLLDDLAEGLIAVENLGVQTSILVATQIFLAFEGVFTVSNVLELREGFSCLAVVHAGNVIWGNVGASFFHVVEFTLLHGTVAVHGEEGLGLSGGRSEVTVELARVDVRIAEGVRGELSEIFI